MCIGFSVDFSAHVAYAYVTSGEGKSSEARIADAMQKMGGPVFQGALSTLVGISALALLPSHMFQVFFKTVFLVMVFGCAHGLIFLPFFLQLFGSAATQKPPGNPIEFTSYSRK